MERLTHHRKSDGAVCPNCTRMDIDTRWGEVVQEVFDKLCAYEDAEEQELLVRLPCKTGDTVYVIRREAKTGKKSIHRGEVINFMIGEDTVVMVVEYECGRIEQGYFKWGWNAFATIEEAEAALAKEG